MNHSNLREVQHPHCDFSCSIEIMKSNRRFIRRIRKSLDTLLPITKNKNKKEKEKPKNKYMNIMIEK